MKRFFWGIFFVSLFASSNLQAQGSICGNTECRAFWESTLKTDDHISEDEFNRAIRNIISEQGINQRAAYTIPTVVHIIHQNGPENISDAVVQTGIDHLNQAYENIGYYDQGTGVNVDIDFCLARRTPDGLSTNGITRDVSSFTDVLIPTEDVSMKDVNRWDPTQYLNIWLVRSISSATGGSGVIGYAYFPGSHGSNVDGIVIEASYFGASQSASAVTAHEAGHYLGLYHTFEGGCFNGDCLADGDQVCDTPPDVATFSSACGSPVNSCSTDEDDPTANNPFRPIALGGLGDQPDMISNYMDYENQACQNDFTQDQKDRMIASLTFARASLLSSMGCVPPCPVNAVADFAVVSDNVPLGTSINFTNNSTSGLNYEWFIDGASFSTAYNTTYTFNALGNYTIVLEVTDDNGFCFETFEMEITVYCPATATFQPSSLTVAPGGSIAFTNTSTNATSYEWYVDGVLESTSANFSYTFNQPGWYSVYLVAFDGQCSSTSVYQFIQVGSGTVGGGLPIWLFTDSDGGELIINDWRTDPPTVFDIPNNFVVNFAGTGIAFDDCGEIAFYATNDGSGNPFSLFLFDKFGNPLLTTTTTNGPGLNGVKGDSEIQVVRVPTSSDEWYVIYKMWTTDVGAPINNGTYTAANILYSRVKYDGTALTVIDRDITLTDNNGMSFTYVDGKAVSRTGPVDDSHYLYASRRAVSSSVVSMDRWIIDANGIAFDRNTGNMPSSYWNLTAAGSLVELSPTEDKVAVTTRNQFNNWTDLIIFDTGPFNNQAGNAQVVQGNDLILQPDGVNIMAPMNLDAASGLPNLGFLRNFERKLSRLEFSPSGQYLYLANGGYGGSGLTNVTYIAQIDLTTAYPYDVRMVVQEVPSGYNPSSGTGCQTSTPSCLASYNGIMDIQSAPDGNLYFTKRAGTTLFVLPDPNSPLTQSLIPSDLDFSTPQLPNIELGHNIIRFPDQIDGYNYYSDAKLRLPIVVKKEPCTDTCITYDLTISADGNVIETYTVEACPQTNYLDTIYFCADSAEIYTLEEIGGISYDTAIMNGAIVYPDDPYFDFTPDYDTIPPDLGADTNFCDVINLVLDAGSSYSSYQWNTGATTQSITVNSEGEYIVVVESLQGCLFSDTIEVNLANSSPPPDLGPDTSSCNGNVFVLDPGEYISYQWNDGSTSPTLTVWQSGTYIVMVTDSCGNQMMDSIMITSNTDSLEVNNFPTDTMICSGETLSVTPQINGTGQYTWESNGQVISTDDMIQISPLIDQQIVLSIINECAVFEDTLNIVVNEPPVATLSGTGSLCGIGDSAVLQISITGGTPPFDLTLSNGTSTIDLNNITSTNFTYNVGEQGNYTIFSINGSECIGSATGMASVTGSNITYDYNLQFDPCFDSLALIEIINVSGGQSPYEYTLNGNNFVADPVFDNLQPSIYDLNVKDNLDCIGQPTSVEIEQSNSFNVMISGPAQACLGDTIDLYANIDPIQLGMEVQWHPATSMICDNCPGTSALLYASTEFVVEVWNSFGCIDADTIYVSAIDPRDIHIPTAFTPNGDNHNDILYILAGPKIEEIITFEIYNRWGEQLFAQYNFVPGLPEFGWDGFYGGSKMEMDNYIFYIDAKLNNGEIVSKKGFFTLLY